MNYYTFDNDGNFKGVTETEPTDNLWTNVPYVDSFIQPKWNGEAWEESGVFDIELFINQLSNAFDLKFETYWKAKGYTDISDLLSHAANPDSVYQIEALSLVKWSHTNWEISVSGLNENSNIQEIINGLEPYE